MPHRHDPGTLLDPLAIRDLLDRVHQSARDGYHEERRTRWRRRLQRILRAMHVLRHPSETQHHTAP